MRTSVVASLLSGLTVTAVLTVSVAVADPEPVWREPVHQVVTKAVP